MHEKTEAAYRQLSSQLQTEFYPHYNLLHRLNLQQRMACIKSNNEKQATYEECIETAKKSMDSHVAALQTSLASINQQDEKCLQRCRTANSPLEC